MVRGTEEGDTDGVDRADSYDGDMAEESNDNDKPYNQHLAIPTSDWLSTRFFLSQNCIGA